MSDEQSNTPDELSFWRIPENQTTNNLVSDLRDPNWTHPPRWLLLRAADEIERLRRLLDGKYGVFR